MILDSSDINEKNKNIENINKQKNKIKIKYYFKKKPPTQIIKIFVKKILTKYCIIAADDDFYIVSTINYFVNFLENNKKIKIINGNAMRLDIVNEERVLVNKYYISKNLEINNPLSRLSRYLNNYGPINTSLILTKNIKKIFEFLPEEKIIKKKCPIKSINDEILIGSLMVLSSNIYHTNKLYLVRSIHGGNSNFSNKVDKEKLFKSIDYFILIIKKYVNLEKRLKLNSSHVSNLNMDLNNYFNDKPMNLKFLKIYNTYFGKIKTLIYKILFIRKLTNKFINNENLLENYIENKKQNYFELNNIKRFLMK